MMLYIPKRINNCDTTQEKTDRQTIFALCVVFFVPAINNFINCLLQIGFGIELSFLTPISYIFMAFVSVLFLYRFIVRNVAFVAVFCLGLIGSIVSYVLYPEIRSIIYGSPVDLVYSPVNKLIFFCMPVFMGIACTKDYDKLFQKMRNWAEITALIGVVAFIVVMVIKGRSLQYMTYSYFMLFPICVCFEYFNKTKNKIDFIIAIVASLAIVACGARGAVVSLLLYFIICFLHYDPQKMTRRQIIRLFSFVFMLIVVVLFYSELIEAVAKILGHFNIDSRTIRYIQEGMFFEDSGRSNINDALRQGLINNPLGYGLYGDRYVVKIFGANNYSYAHNVFLEMLCQFGIIIGSIMVILIVYYMVRLIRSVKGRKEIHIVLSVIPYGFFQLFFSSSYLENIVFWALMGLATFGIKNNINIFGDES